ncbi:MAG: peptidoglycan DD-metalloendopeptidase family protein [Chitinivibrionales bacterium]|nr:peptidoglycan DD-metalloendopeptidase family protein [Chitinivibrionales bacterium]
MDRRVLSRAALFSGVAFCRGEHGQADHLRPQGPGREYAVRRRHRCVHRDAVHARRHTAGRARGADCVAGRLAVAHIAPWQLRCGLGTAVCALDRHTHAWSRIRVVGQFQSGRQVSGVACVLMVAACVFVAGAQQRQQQTLSKYKDEIRRRSSSLDSIKAELEKGRARIEQLRTQEKSSQTVLRQLERNIEMAEDYLTELERTIDSLDMRIGELGRSLTRERRNLSSRQQAMEQRLVSMYKVSFSNPLSMFAGLDGPTEALKRVFYFRRLKAYDAHLIEAIRQTKSRIESDKTSLEAVREEQQALLDEKKDEQELLLAERRSREAMLSEIRSEKETYLAQVADLESAQKQLQLLLTQLESRKAAAAAELERSLSSKFAQRKGKLAWPVLGEIVKQYGRVVHPVYKTVTMNNGIDIAVRPGETVRCVAPGTVAYVGRMRGLGRFIVVDHYGGYLTIYANLGSISVAKEDDVEYGSTLGRAGPATAGERSTVHFELRKSTKALDPGEWLEVRG